MMNPSSQALQRQEEGYTGGLKQNTVPEGAKYHHVCLFSVMLRKAFELYPNNSK